jgi:hypothetical protein
MAEIDAEELARGLILWGEKLPGVIRRAAEAHLASLRAPKGELAEARAELGAWLVEHPGHQYQPIWQQSCAPQWCVEVWDDNPHNEPFRGTGPTEAAAIIAALSRARGEGT